MKNRATTLFSYLFSRMFIVVFGVSLAFSIALVPIYKGKLLQMIALQGQTISNTTIAACAEALYKKDYGYVMSYVTAVLEKTPEIKSMTLTALDGEVVHITKGGWSTNKTAENTVLTFENETDYLLEHIDSDPSYDTPDVFMFTQNVNILGFDWGTLSLTISDDNYQALMRSYLQNVVLSSFILLVISLSLLYKFSKRLASQLTILKQQALELAKGNLAARSIETEHGIDEISQLSVSFNSMAYNLETQSQKLTQLAKLVESTDDAIIIFSSQREVSFVNHAFLSLTEKTADFFIGMSLHKLLDFLGVKSDRKRDVEVELNTVIEKTWMADITLNDGHKDPIYMTLRVEAFDEQNEDDGFFIVLNNITYRKRMEQELEVMAYSDKLTGLPNRSFFMDQLEKTLAEPSDTSAGLAVLFLDLDNFKIINDTLGHHAGDELLRQIAGRLKEILRSDDLICRLGGDEFTIVILGLTDKVRLIKLANLIIEHISQPIKYQRRYFHVGTSIGIVRYPDDGQDVHTLIKNADTAMYEAKKSGKSAYRFFTQEMNESIQEILEVETLLREAIKRSELYLVYQPFVDGQTGQITGCEALLRWDYADNPRYASPAVFIPIAEKNGLINLIGEWVFAEVCKQISLWQSDIKVSINVSGNELKEPGFVQRLLTELSRYKIHASQIQLEFTEHALVADSTDTLTKLNELRRAGFSIAIDDFGTGFSSLSYITQLPVDVIKIDRSFIKELPHEVKTLSVVKAIITLSNSLGLKTVAEGVESEEQLSWLVDTGCSTIQGYYYYKPMLADAFVAELDNKQQKQLLSNEA